MKQLLAYARAQAELKLTQHAVPNSNADTILEHAQARPDYGHPGWRRASLQASCPLDASRGPGMYDAVNLPLLGQQQAVYAHQPMHDFSKGVGRQLDAAPTTVSRGS